MKKGHHYVYRGLKCKPFLVEKPWNGENRQERFSLRVEEMKNWFSLKVPKINKKSFRMYVKYINSNMYAKYGDNANNEYLEKRLFTTF